MSYPRDEARPLPSYPSATGSRPLAVARPPLTARMRPGHWMAIDIAAGAAAAILAMFVFAHTIGHPQVVQPQVVQPQVVQPQVVRLRAGQNQTVALSIDLLLAALVFFPVALRRTRPVAAYSVLIAMAVILSEAGTGAPEVVFLAAAYVLYLVTATSNRRTGAAALALALAAMGLVAVRQSGPNVNANTAAYVPVAFAMVIAWMIGYSVRQRRLYARALQHQAASSAVAEERLRIARELHDVVAHSMSVIAVQAGYGQYVIDTSPADARDALGAIQATSRDALEEMRRMLGVLRQQDAAAGRASPSSRPVPLAPAPGLSDLDRLIQRTCGAGIQVSVQRSGRVRAVPAGVDMSAYRIIQEALTNVVKHAGGGAACTVRLDYGDDALDIQVTDDGGRSLVLTTVGAGAPSAAGHGIIGMRERANLCGGEFSAAPLPRGGFRVIAVLPLLPAPATPAAAPPAAPAAAPPATPATAAPATPAAAVTATSAATVPAAASAVTAVSAVTLAIPDIAGDRGGAG